MKSYLISLGIFVTSFFSLHFIMFLTQLGVESESSRWMHEAFAIKESRARSIEGAKVLIISGSSSLFSFSAKQMSEDIEVPTVNCGIHAGLKLEYILDRYINLVEEGDIVVLPLEYSSYAYDGSTSETLADFASSRDPEWILAQPSRLLNTAFSFDILELAQRNVKRFLPDETMIGYYDASYISAYGDKENIPSDLMTEKEYAVMETFSALTVRLSDASREVLSEFFFKCQERGAKVALTFPVTMYFKEYEHADFLNDIDEIREFANDCGVSVLGDPRGFLLSKDLLFNSNYHANLAGRKIATDRLIELLKPFLKMSIGESGRDGKG